MSENEQVEVWRPEGSSFFAPSADVPALVEAGCLTADPLSQRERLRRLEASARRCIARMRKKADKLDGRAREARLEIADREEAKLAENVAAAQARLDEGGAA